MDEATNQHYFPVPERRLSRRAIVGAVIFSALLLIMAAAYLALRPGYKPLFTGLKPQDASAIIAELEKQKIPFRIDEDNAAILVPESDARAARIKLMSGSLRLSNVVGLELFDDSDLGLTDFAQKVNYQRALQGELARTIMSLEEVGMARVHLTLPESSLFRSHRQSPKASVAIFTQGKQILRPAEIRGIQHLVAAAVPEMSPTDVTVLDDKGAALSSGIDENEAYQLRKRSLEEHTADKVASQLRDYLPGFTFTVSANIELNDTPASPTTDARDTDSETGDIVPAISISSSIAHIAISVIVDRPLDAGTQTRAMELIATSAGLNRDRGDQASILSRSSGVSTLPVESADNHPMKAFAGIEDGIHIEKLHIGILAGASAVLLIGIILVISRLTGSGRRRERLLVELRESLASKNDT